MRKYTKDQLIKKAKKYKTFKGLLKNRYLYYTLHNYGILREATSHLKRAIPRTRFSKPVLDLAVVIEAIRNCKTPTEIYRKHASMALICRRNNIDVRELYDNINDENYIRSFLKVFGQEQVYNFLEK